MLSTFLTWVSSTPSPSVRRAHKNPQVSHQSQPSLLAYLSFFISSWGIFMFFWTRLGPLATPRVPFRRGTIPHLLISYASAPTQPGLWGQRPPAPCSHLNAQPLTSSGNKVGAQQRTLTSESRAFLTNGLRPHDSESPKMLAKRKKKANFWWLSPH